MRPIIISTDLSQVSENALREGVRLARDLGADVVFAHAWEPPALTVMDAMIALPPAQLAEHVGAMQKRLDEVAARFRPEHAGVTTRLVEGPPTEAISALATEIDARLIVTGTGVPRVLSLILGSVAASLVRTAPCPVVVVRAH